MQLIPFRAGVSCGCCVCTWELTGSVRWLLLETSIYVTVINSDAEWDSSDPDAPCVGGFSTGLTARSLQLNESERECEGCECEWTKRSTTERDALTDREKRLGNQWIVLRLEEETDTCVPFPTLLCRHLVLESRSPLTSPNSARSLSPYLTLGTVTLTGHHRPTKVTFPRSYYLNRELMYAHFNVSTIYGFLNIHALRAPCWCIWFNLIHYCWRRNPVILTLNSEFV